MKYFVTFSYRAPNDRLCFTSLDITTEGPISSSADIQRIHDQILSKRGNVVLSDMRILAFSKYED